MIDHFFAINNEFAILPFYMLRAHISIMDQLRRFPLMHVGTTLEDTVGLAVVVMVECVSWVLTELSVDRCTVMAVAVIDTYTQHRNCLHGVNAHACIVVLDTIHAILDDVFCLIRRCGSIVAKN